MDVLARITCLAAATGIALKEHEPDRSPAVPQQE